MRRNSLDSFHTFRKSIFNWDLFIGNTVDKGSLKDKKKAVNSLILNEEVQDIDFLIGTSTEIEGSSQDSVTKASEIEFVDKMNPDEPEYDEILLPDDEIDQEEADENDDLDISDESEYYSDYGEETDTELEKEIPDAGGES